MILLQVLKYSDLYNVFKITATIVTICAVLIACFAIYQRKRFKGAYKWLYYYIIFAAIIEVFNNYAIDFLKLQNTQFISYIYLFLETLFYGLFYFTIIAKIYVKRAILLFLWVVLIFVFSSAFYNKGYLSLPTKSVLLEHFFVISASIYLFYEIYLNKKIFSLSRQPIFLFNLYILISFFSSILFFLFIDASFKISQNLGMLLYIVRNIISISCYSLWIYATLQLKKFTPTSTPKPLQPPRGLS